MKLGKCGWVGLGTGGAAAAAAAAAGGGGGGGLRKQGRKKMGFVGEGSEFGWLNSLSKALHFLQPKHHRMLCG